MDKLTESIARVAQMIAALESENLALKKENATLWVQVHEYQDAASAAKRSKVG